MECPEDLGMPHASEHDARQSFGLLNVVVNLLPVGVTAQAEDGRFLYVNDTAAVQFGVPVDALIGSSPAAVLPPDQAARRRDQEIDLARSGESMLAEEIVICADGDRTLLTSRKPVRIADATLLLSTSLDITERKQTENDLLRRAYFDDLTGLPNRGLVERHAEDIIESKAAAGRFALAFIDIDNFKSINDYYSHAIGDALLVKVAQRITANIRGSDMLARISGDEFVLVLDPIDDEDQLRGIIDRVLQELRQPFFIEGFEVFTSASIGISIYPEHGREYEALRRNADGAMYRAKDGAKGSAVLFDLNMGKAITARMELEQRLRLAIRDRRFCCAFQPKVDIRTTGVVGFEALVRLRDEDGIIQGPGDFIGLAVELGLIDDITRLVLTETIMSLDRLDGAFGPDTTISINVAAKQATDLTFMRSFAQALKETDCAARFMLELTEDAFLSKGEFQTQVLPLLRELGVRVSIDDFGTGYSSLSALADITADEIKVDRSFITGIHQRPRSQSILKAIESLSYALGMSIVAEGVETFEELAYLQAATRIRCAQGYYFAKPFFLEDLNVARSAPGEQRDMLVSRERASLRGPRPPRAMGDAAGRRS